MAVAAAVALRLEVGKLLLIGWGLFGTPANVGNTLTGLALFLLAPFVASAIVPWAATLWRIRRDRKQHNRANDHEERAADRREDSPISAAPPYSASPIVPRTLSSQNATASAHEASAHEASARVAPPRDLIPLAVSLYVWSVAATALACWAAALAAWQTQGVNWTLPLPPLPPAEWPLLARPASALAILAALLTVLCYIGWLARWRWATPLLLRPRAHYAIRWHRQTLGLMLIVSSVAYLIFGLASLAPRRAAAMQFDAYLQRGEIANLK
jgi:hypothetical protein